MENSFRNKIDSDYSNKPATRIRWNKSLDFIGDDCSYENALDIGDRSELTEMMESKYQIKFDNTKGDLDYITLKGNFDLITSFEVLEHLFNPLFHLSQIKGVLSENGKLILSTPLSKPRFLWSKEHFHEMSIKSIEALFHVAGFKIVRKEYFRVHPLIFYIKGIRPLLRLFFDKIQIYELEHSNEFSK